MEEDRSLRAPGNPLCLGLSPSGRHVLFDGHDGIVRVWDRTDHKELPPLTGLSEKLLGEPDQFKPGIMSLIFSPDGTMLAGVRGGAPHFMQYIGLWKWPTGELAHRLSLSRYEMVSVVFSPDSRRLIATATGRSAVWDTGTGDVVGEWIQEKHNSNLGPAAPTPDSRHIYTRSLGWYLQKRKLPDLSLVELDPQVRATRPELPFETDPHTAPAAERVLPDGTRLLVGRGGHESLGVVHLDAKGSRIHYFLERRSVGFDVSPNGKLLVTHGHGGGPSDVRELPLQFWDVSSGRELAAVPVNMPLPNSNLILFSPDGKRLAMGHHSGLVRIWDVGAKEPALTLSTEGYAVHELAFSRDGRFLVGGHGNAPAVIWDLSEAK